MTSRCLGRQPPLTASCSTLWKLPKPSRTRKTLARKASLEADITTNTAKPAAVTAALDDLAGEPVSEFRPSQWSALIDHAIVDEDTIRFVLRVGEEVSVQL